MCRSQPIGFMDKIIQASERLSIAVSFENISVLFRPIQLKQFAGKGEEDFCCCCCPPLFRQKRKAATPSAARKGLRCPKTAQQQLQQQQQQQPSKKEAEAERLLERSNATVSTKAPDDQQSSNRAGGEDEEEGEELERRPGSVLPPNLPIVQQLCPLHAHLTSPRRRSPLKAAPPKEGGEGEEDVEEKGGEEKEERGGTPRPNAEKRPLMSGDEEKQDEGQDEGDGENEEPDMERDEDEDDDDDEDDDEDSLKAPPSSSAAPSSRVDSLASNATFCPVCSETHVRSQEQRPDDTDSFTPRVRSDKKSVTVLLGKEGEREVFRRSRRGRRTDCRSSDLCAVLCVLSAFVF